MLAQVAAPPLEPSAQGEGGSTFSAGRVTTVQIDAALADKPFRLVVEAHTALQQHRQTHA